MKWPKKRSGQFSSVTQSCPTLCNPMNCSMPGFPVHHQLPEFTQTHAHRVSDAISHLILCRPLLLLPPIPPSIRVFSNESTLRMRWSPLIFTFSCLLQGFEIHTFIIFPLFIYRYYFAWGIWYSWEDSWCLSIHTYMCIHICIDSCGFKVFLTFQVHNFKLVTSERNLIWTCVWRWGNGKDHI